jgi:hypothetical protein
LGSIIKNPTDFTLGILLALVFALDIATTQICLSTGIGHEANPIMRVVVDNPLLMIAVKGAALALVIGVVNLYKTKWIAYFGMPVVIGITLGAVINNLLVIL